MITKRKFVIDGAKFEGFAGFIAEFNQVYVSEVGGLWNGNMDAFNDYLTWHKTEYILRWKNSRKSRQNLGHLEMANWLESILTTCHPNNQTRVRKRIRDANRKSGQTLFELIVEIVTSDLNSEWVELRLE